MNKLLSILSWTLRAVLFLALANRDITRPEWDLEWLATLPSSLKVRGQEGKYLLKKALTGLLPDHIVNRRKKGFGIPLTRWLRSPRR